MNVKPYNASHDSQVDFFDSIVNWKMALDKMFPSATIRIDDAGVSRAFTEHNKKVATFGKLPGLGYVATSMGAKIINQAKLRTNQNKLNHSIAAKKRWAQRKKKLTHEELSAIHRTAALKRWGGGTARSTRSGQGIANRRMFK